MESVIRLSIQAKYPKFFNGTETRGISLALTPTIFLGDVSIGASFDKRGNFAIQATTGVATTIASSPSASAGVFRTITNAPDVFVLEGDGGFIGGSIVEPVEFFPLMVGADAVIVGDLNNRPFDGENYGGATFTVGVGIPPEGGEVHGGETYTWTLIKGNYTEWILNGIYGKPEEIKCE